MSRTELSNLHPVDGNASNPRQQQMPQLVGSANQYGDHPDSFNRGRGGVPYWHRASGYRPGDIPDRDPKPVDTRKR